MVREGLFGSATVDIRSGFPTGTFDGFTAGKILPESNLVSFTGSTTNQSSSVQVSVHRRKLGWQWSYVDFDSRKMEKRVDI